MDKSWVRRPVSLLVVAMVAVLLPLVSPLWLVVGGLIDSIRGRWRMPIARLLVFATCWAWLEIVGLLGAGVLIVSRRGSDRLAFYRIQQWWCRNIVACLSRIVGLRVEVSGVDELGDGPFVLLARHVSLADAVMSSWVVGSLMKKNPRYVLKNELKLDPCLDVFGHRLPNYFIDRNADVVSIELAGIQQMATDLGKDDVAVIFPEGTRSNDAKRRERMHQLASRSPQRFQKLQNLKFLLPPKPAGAMALLQSVPHANVVTLAHCGLEGLDSFKSILRNFGKHIVHVRISVARIDRAQIPSGDAFVAWIDDQWLKMDSVVQSYVLKAK